MANPRKFSEKIALHTHRQAEETARFEQIMREVSDATARQEESSHNNTRHSRESRARSQGGPIRRPQDRKHDTSPYSANPFLSPPPDTSWRRTNSDSALHQSATQGAGINERNDNLNNRWILQTINGPQNFNNRPRSSCEIPRVPGMNMYPSGHDPGSLQIPIGNNTGSLPDLTSVHFPPAIHTSIENQDQGNSAYSVSPVNNNPLSPSVLTRIRPQDRFPYSGQFTHRHQETALDSNLVELMDRTDFDQLSNFDGIFQCHENQQQQNHHQQNQQQHHQQQQQKRQQQKQQQIAPHSSSPTLQHPSGYRTSRPSPQSSPSLGGHISEPCSPSGAPSPLSVSSPSTPGASNDYYMLNQHQLQQHFEQFSMMDPPLSPVSGVSYADITNNINVTQSQTQMIPKTSAIGNSELSTDAGYYSTSPSQIVYPTTAPSSLHTTPNTPTSIPDIILTDFSSGDDLTRQNLTMTKQLEAELLSDESLREGLAPLDLDGLQILSDPGINLIPDSVEDHFRLDRL